MILTASLSCSSCIVAVVCVVNRKLPLKYFLKNYPPRKFTIPTKQDGHRTRFSQFLDQLHSLQDTASFLFGNFGHWTQNCSNSFVKNSLQALLSEGRALQVFHRAHVFCHSQTLKKIYLKIYNWKIYF